MTALQAGYGTTVNVVNSVLMWRGNSVTQMDPRSSMVTAGMALSVKGKNESQETGLSQSLHVFVRKRALYAAQMAPRIRQGPRNLSSSVGNDIVFSCEVSAFPLPVLSWKKTGIDHFLPGDDPHISVQVRGGPQRYSVSTWLQIYGLHVADTGVYSCISHNSLGETSASAQLTVLSQESGTEVTDEHSDHREDDSDELVASGDHLRYTAINVM
ncbi:uncharacterized protein V6R79_025296 [Siganus canaliculatus]